MKTSVCTKSTAEGSSNIRSVEVPHPPAATPKVKMEDIEKKNLEGQFEENHSGEQTRNETSVLKLDGVSDNSSDWKLPTIGTRVPLPYVQDEMDVNDGGTHGNEGRQEVDAQRTLKEANENAANMPGTGSRSLQEYLLMLLEQQRKQQALDGTSPVGYPLGLCGVGSHAVQDYQMQLMLLEQQHKKRLLLARQEAEADEAQKSAAGGPSLLEIQLQGTIMKQQNMLRDLNAREGKGNSHPGKLLEATQRLQGYQTQPSHRNNEKNLHLKPKELLKQKHVDGELSPQGFYDETQLLQQQHKEDILPPSQKVPETEAKTSTTTPETDATTSAPGPQPP